MNQLALVLLVAAGPACNALNLQGSRDAQFPGFNSRGSWNPLSWIPGAGWGSSGSSGVFESPHVSPKDTPSQTALHQTLVKNEHDKADVCFVHIGKTGGESVLEGLQQLQRQGGVEHLVHIHQRVDQETGKYYSKLAGPAIGGHNEKKCAETKNVVVWVRDPIGRFISCWKAHVGREENGGLEEAGGLLVKHKIATRSHFGDLNYILENLANATDGHGILTKVMSHVPHMVTGAPFYFSNCEHLASLPITFVGRTESMEHDWKDLIERITTRPREPKEEERLKLAKKHAHQHHLEGLHLSAQAIKFLSEQPEIQQELQCLRAIKARGFLSDAYTQAVAHVKNDYKFSRSQDDGEDFQEQEWTLGEGEELTPEN